MHDGFAVREAIERFHDAVNRRRPTEIAALFADEGVWEVAPPFELKFEGRAAIEAGISGTIGATELLVQTCGPIVVDFVGLTRAQARTSMQEFGRFHDGTSMHVAGIYHDELERHADGSWRFLQRRFVAHYADELPVPGRALLVSGSPSAETRTDPIERQAIDELIAGFASAINARDFAAAAALFADDAIWTSSAGELGFRQDGRAAIGDFLSKSAAHVDALYYLIGLPSITLLGEGRARSSLAMVEVIRIKGTDERRLLLGTYADELVKIDGAWRFKLRHATVRHAETLRGTALP